MDAASLRRYFEEDLFAGPDRRVPFERFMAEALYHPEFGYYTAKVTTVGGRRGDFATGPTLSPVLGAAVAGWLRHAWRELEMEADPRLHVIEIGGGDGSLALAVLRALGWSLRRRVPYHLVEVSAPLRRRQAETLGRLGRGVQWHREVREALEAAGGRALLFSNELVDAFPVVQLVGRGEGKGFCEVWLERDGPGGVREHFEPYGTASDPPEAARTCAIFEHPEFQAEGQRLELHLAYRSWLREWAPALERGRLLTIDYGDEMAALYARRPGGTVRGYFRHQRREGAAVYECFGRQDITCDVNFTDLRRWGEELSWASAPLLTQAEFLQRFLPERRWQALSKDRATAFIAHPEGAGSAFKVLQQDSGDGRFGVVA